MKFLIFAASTLATANSALAFVATSNHPARSSSLPITATTTTLDATALHEKFTTLQPAFAPDINPVAAGGWYNIEQNMGNPKDDLVSLIVQGLSQDSSKVEFQTNTEQVEALVAVLYAYGQGFDADLVEGDWKLVFSLQGRKSPKFQKVVGTQETAGKTDNTFDTHRMTFSGDATILKKGTIGSTVKYNPVGEGFSKSVDGKVVLRRIACDIVGASWKFWFFPKIPLPLRVKGGSLDFVYMDEDIRITRGNRGGLFVHFRPDFLKDQLLKK